MLKILTMNLFYKYSMNIHHLQKMLVANLVLATRYDGEYVVIGAIIPFVARSGCFYEE